MELNRVYRMDNLELMKKLDDNSIDLIYGDILYGTGKKFKDYQDLKPKKEVIEEFYIPRLKEMHRILKHTGSIYLQMDYRIVHWVRCIMDDIFGYKNFRNEIIWCYKSSGFSKNRYSSKHDNILFYSKSSNWTFNLNSVRETEIAEATYKRFKKEIDNGLPIIRKLHGKEYKQNPYSPPLDWVYIKNIAPTENSRVGYDTQKPKKLLERIIKASSNEGDIVADFFCGSGVTGVVAKELGRKYLLCDINPKAVKISRTRLKSIGDYDTI